MGHQRASSASALLSCILLTQQMVCTFASPVRPRNVQGVSIVLENTITTSTTESEAAAATTAPPAQPPSARSDMWQGYPQVQKLMDNVGPTGILTDLSMSNELPTALWNTTAVNMTEACHKYLAEHLSSTHDSTDSCAPTYVCDVADDYHRFPAVLIHAKCDSDRQCNNAEHTGLGRIPGSQGNCVANRQVTVVVLTFQSDARQSSGTDSTAAAVDPSGKWADHFDLLHIPIDCGCIAK